LGEPELWAEDGPTANPACPAATPVCSTVKIFSGTSATLSPVIATGTGAAPFVGINRADELCYDSDDNIVLIANDADSPPFDTFIDATTHKVLGRTTLNGGLGNPLATNGIEQCQYDHTHHVFFQNIPEVSGPGNGSVAGAVIVFRPSDVMTAAAAGANGLVPVAHTVSIPVGTCAGPQGMALNEQPTTPTTSVSQILLGCNAQTTPLEGHLSADHKIR
jgi:hypothetical protein